MESFRPGPIRDELVVKIMALDASELKGFQEKDIQVGNLNARLWKLEEENVKIREEIRELVAAVRGWKREEEGGFGEMKDIYEELREMRGREIPERKGKQETGS